MQIGSAAAANPYATTGAQAASSLGATPASMGDKAVQDFMAYAKMTPAEKMRAEILGQMGMTEDQLKAMDPKERAKVEEKIKEMIKLKVEQDAEKKTGMIVDMKA